MKRPFTVGELRQSFLDFFESKKHLIHESYSLVPENDNSLLLINAGMAPLKPYFTGQITPPKKRMATCQKCIRTGDIDNVGKTSRHATFFEMLGNFSFGDYFKKEAIKWSWEYLVDVVGLDPNRLYVSVYFEDDEAYKIWNQDMGIDKDRIFKFGKEDNFWEHGAGPCGPCSEIYYDRGEKYGCKKDTCTVGCDCDRYVEVWNNVFTQFESDGKGNYTPLTNKNIDTGMGLERLAVAVQDVDSIFDIDTLKSLRDYISKLANVEYNYSSTGNDISIRVITDHIRAITFMASDGIFPSNEGRGYVFRRLLRRACRHGRLLNINTNFLSDLCDVVIDSNKEGYPELEKKRDFIKKIIDTEESQFNKTLDSGLSILNKNISLIKKNNGSELSGEIAFKLHDTYGFPIDLTTEILSDNNIKVNINEFNKCMDEQKNTARNARKITNYMGSDSTIYESLDKDITSVFDGYENLEVNSTAKILLKDGKIVDTLNDGDYAEIILDKTSLYATSGGQEHDTGIIYNDNFIFEVHDVKKIINDKITHIGIVKEGSIKTNDKVKTKYDTLKRNLTRANHSATHLLQKALREVLGSHVEQAGSFVNDEYLRFDFSHFQAMTKEEIIEVERRVNEQIDASLNVVIKEMPIEEAKKTGANALFGEKYGEKVRVVFMGDYSIEFCGGTHVENTNSIKAFKIISESSAAAGIRRIEAKTSNALIKMYENNNYLIDEICSKIKTNKDDLLEKIIKLNNEKNKLEKELKELKINSISNKNNSEINPKACVNDVNIFAEKIDNVDINELTTISDDIKSKNESSFILLASSIEDRVAIIASCTKKAIEKGANCNDLIKKVSSIVLGSGGGKPNMARAGGKDTSKIDELIENSLKEMTEMIK